MVRVGDAVPRSMGDSTLIDAIEPLLATNAAPRLEIARWSLRSADLDVSEAAQARVFVEDSTVIAVVGHAGSQTTLLAAPIYRDAGVPLIIPTATARELRDTPGLFMLAPTDDAVGAFIVDAALDSLRGRRIALMHIADAYGEGIRRGVVDRLRTRGAALVADAVMTGRECEPDPLAGRVIAQSLLQRSKPDVVVIALSQRLAGCLIAVLVNEAPGIRIITSDSYVPSTHRSITERERRAVHSVSFWEPGTDSLSRQFVSAFRATTGRHPEPGQALAFDAFLLVQQAVQEGRTTRESLSTWLRELGTAKHPPVVGVTGPIDFQAPRTAVLHLRHLSDPTPFR